MPKRRANLLTRAADWEQKRLAERTLREYRPFLTVRDVPSHGRSHRIQSKTVRRMHHLFSDLERAAFYALDNSGAFDIREQYPLLPTSETTAIASALSYRPARFAGQLIVMTTDFLVTWPDGAHEAYAVKRSEDLSRPRSKQKLDIEAEYWSRRGIRWHILTEIELSSPRIAALGWLHRYGDPSSVPVDESLLEKIISKVRNLISEGPEVSLAEACKQCDRLMGITLGTSLAAARHAIAAGLWAVDMSMGIDPLRPIRWSRP